MIDKIKCFLGYHEWVDECPLIECNQKKRNCKRCKNRVSFCEYCKTEKYYNRMKRESIIVPLVVLLGICFSRSLERGYIMLSIILMIFILYAIPFIHIALNEDREDQRIKKQLDDAENVIEFYADTENGTKAENYLNKYN